MSTYNLPPVTLGGEEYSNRFASVIGAAFANDALNRAVILMEDSLPNDAIISDKRRHEHFLAPIQKHAASGAVVAEAGNWAAVAMWVPPGMKRPLPDLSTVSALIREYWEKFAVLKKKHMGDREYWYLNLIGRDPKRNDKGAIRALFEPYLKQAQEANVPAWLEATNTHARDVYAHFGFQVVEEVIIGKGRVARNGNLEAGGEGVVIYAMIVEPQAS